MIKGTVIGQDKVSQRLNAAGDKIITAVAKRIQGVLFHIEGRVKEDKLSGQVLKNPTGTLRRSIHPSDVVITSSSISGTVGTNLEYAAYHEFGFEGVSNVKEHIRKAKNSSKESLVKAHTRNVNYPEHSYLRSTVKEQKDYAINEIQAGVKEGASA